MNDDVISEALEQADAFTLGQRVSWSPANELHRDAFQTTEPAVDGMGAYRRTVYHKAWRSWVDRFPGLPMPRSTERRTGVVVGIRTLSNGRIQWGGEDEPTTFLPEEYIPAVLVAYAMHRKPVHVRPQLLTPEASRG